MIKPLALAVSVACALLSTQSNAYDYGEHANTTLEKLITDYPGRYRGTANFAGAADWMQSQMGSAYNISRQDFTWNGGSRASQNVVAYAAGTKPQYVVIGAHFDTYFGRPTLQGLDDNGSGASVLTEVAKNLGGLQLENGLQIVGFGAEEEGLRGSRAFVDSLSASQRANMLAMINLDSLITGDMMYAHAGQNSTANPALASLREHTFQIAKELNINLFTNPGLDAQYPAGTGCCSDGEAFEALNIPILYIEATNWELGDLDGYTQTDNPAIPGGSTWHDPNEDNKTVLTNAFGQERIDQRLRDYSRLLSRLVLELTNADLMASTTSGGAVARNMQDNLQRQHQAMVRLHDRRWLTLQSASREVGTFDGEIGVDGEYNPDSGFDTAPNPEARRLGLHALGDYQLSSSLNIGASLSYLNGRDKLEHRGKLESDTWQAAVYALLNDGGPTWLAGDLSVGHSSFDSKRNLVIQANGGPVLLDQQLTGETDALSLGARLLGGYDFDLGAIKTGPFAGLDYSHSRIDKFHEKQNLRTALEYEEQSFDSLEASLGWRMRGAVALPYGLSLMPYGDIAWVKELADGRLDDLDLTARADGQVRTARLGSVDKSFGRAQVGSQLAITPQLGVYAEVNGRLGHAEGSQTGYSLGVQWMF
ncbi:autotransporter domain-containing protein [Pseudomonas proteolytica]|uniref:Autotransporter domain-containing protein n=1 Tax=Pseudomonas proteolytica TaxID=219574 RepID=A0AAW5ABI7_9PSED|nr:autotransporter domain-containing protein [Pseudomonas proteolytica]KAA8697129.1 autotransporter domain-containing protein [Pseudomonas proteolytica]MCF5059719.1 autotransporter domain-containing protein [Pseudomonas proteolytica]MCF5104979.1 autotransporter domain-containing protein [Pseudomonas proteolytica]TWR78404.1 autotransporter domain-containing protein [Pseudomonas proteolytica]